MPEKLKRAVVKEEFVALTDDILSALILNQFLYWAERVKDIDEYIIEEKKRAKKGEELDLEINKTHGWIYKSAEEMKEEVMATVSTKTVKRRINKLVDKGWIEVRRNPKYDWDKTNQYRPNLIKLNEDLMEIGYILQGYKFDLSELIKRKNIPSDTVSIREDKMSVRGGHSVDSNGQFVQGCNNKSDENKRKPLKSPKSPKGQFDGSKGHDVGSNGQIDDSKRQNDGAIPEIIEEEDEEKINNNNLLLHLLPKTKELYLKVFNKELNFVQEKELVEKIKKGADQNLIYEAVKTAALNNATSFNYITATLDDWIEKEITSVSDLNKYLNKKRKTNGGGDKRDQMTDIEQLEKNGWNQ